MAQNQKPSKMPFSLVPADLSKRPADRLLCADKREVQ